MSYSYQSGESFEGEKDYNSSYRLRIFDHIGDDTENQHRARGEGRLFEGYV